MSMSSYEIINIHGVKKTYLEREIKKMELVLNHWILHLTK